MNRHINSLFIITLFIISGSYITAHAQEARTSWGKINYKGKPWVENVSKANSITHGLQNRHLSVTASHGRYYDQGKGVWKWQRPNLFCTTEDLFTQTIVVPYLIPMLEKAGAIVFTARERDWQRQEIIIDNDDTTNPYAYREKSYGHSWTTTGIPGFALHAGNYTDGENPFTQGTARMSQATSSKNHLNSISYQPDFQCEGKYAVYVSYQTLINSVDDACYTVYHKGQETVFHVNQQMGGGTWVYLGTFEFDKGCNPYNRVVLTNQSKKTGVVTADAVRFGGGMGNIERGGTRSGLPRCLEGARYNAQWSGAPYSVISASNGKNDYNDDINSRSLFTNWVGGGSCYMPTLSGLKVPIELSLAVHSDAGVKDNDIVGTLSICTTNNEGKTTLNSGLSRTVSKTFAESLLNNADRDIRQNYQTWNKRSLYDKSYSESRRPEVPSAILETLSHQNFTDMRLGLDPNFRFTFARSIYKTILRYVSNLHGTSCVVAPLQPNNFRIEFASKKKAVLKWTPVNDPHEPSAKPSSYIVYMATGTSGFDNGTETKSTQMKIKLEPGVLYRFKVTACNHGGESFPTEVLTAVYQPGTKKTVLVVNGFHRLSSPAVINTETAQGFDLDTDIGLTYGPTAGWNGRQSNFDRSRLGLEGPGALGYSGDELAGYFIPGNDFNYVVSHTEAIMASQQYNIISCSSEAVENDKVNLRKYQCVDLLLGLEKNDGHSLVYYKTFSPLMQQKLTDYARHNGRLLVSGSYVGSDMVASYDRDFIGNILKIQAAGTDRQNTGNTVNGLGTSFKFYRQLNESHYAATAPDVIQPVGSAFCAMRYDSGREAAVAYKGPDYRVFTMGFPFECIIDANSRSAIMRGILRFLIDN